MKQCPKCGFLIKDKTQICPGRYPSTPCGYDFTNEDNENLKNLCIIDQELQKKQPISKPIYLYIPIIKLILMSIVSIGLYEVYWLYKNWRFIKERDEPDILPFWRGIFGIFFCYSLFKRIKKDTETNNILKAEFDAVGNASCWIIFNILGHIIGRISNDIISILIGFILMYITFIFFIPVQLYINRVNRLLVPKPNYSPWSLGHSVCLIIGIIIWFGIIKTIFFL